MYAYDVPRHEWIGFCERFAQHHRGEPVTVRIADESIETSRPGESGPGRRALAQGVGLRDLRVDSSDVRRWQIRILAGEHPDNRFEYLIESPAGLRLEQPPGNGPGRLRIDTLRGHSVLVQLSGPVNPDMLEGLP